MESRNEEKLSREEMIRRQRERRRKVRQRRMRRARMIRAALCLGLLAVCVFTGVLVAGKMGLIRGAKGDKASAQTPPVQELSETVAEQTMPEPVAPPKSWEGNLPEIGALYGIAVNGAEWSHFYVDNSYAMAPKGKYVRSFRATLHNQPEDMTGTIEYRVNLRGSGLLDWTDNGGEGGDSGGEMPLESLAIRLTGELGENYDVLYCVLQDQKWSDWVSNGAEAGVSGFGKCVEGVRVSIQKKGSKTSYAGGIDPTGPMVALTFNDGPSESATSRILAALRQSGARATFFAAGAQAVQSPDLVRQMAEQGCEVGNYTYDRKVMTKLSKDEFANQLAAANQAISDISGIRPVLMRPCEGKQSDAGMAVLAANSMPAVLWSLDALDTETKDAAKIVNKVLDTVKDGDIILMHDTQDVTAEAVELLIPELMNRGYQLVTVSELSSYRRGMVPGGVYREFPPNQAEADGLENGE